MKSTQVATSKSVNLAEIQQHYWNLRAINGALDKTGPSQSAHSITSPDYLISVKREVLKRVQDYIRTAVSFQYDTLGIVWGAFGIANNVSDQFLVDLPNILFSRPSFPMIDIPWGILAEGDDRFEEFIDYLCTQQREIQPLSDPNAFAPELYWDLPPRNHYPADLVHPFTNVLKANFDFLYCTLGEVTFFLLAWRLLFRSCQKCGEMACLTPGQVTLAEGVGMTQNWTDTYPSFWETLESDDEKGSKEQAWFESVSQLRGGLSRGNLNSMPEALKEEIASQWEYWRKVLDDHTGGIHPYVSDWIQIGLLPQEYDPKDANCGPLVTTALLATLRFAIHVSATIKIELRVRETLAGVVATLTRTLDEKTSIPHRTLFELDQILQAVIHGFLRTLDNDVSIRAQMEKLHGIARFPLLNFFYTNSVCHCQAVQLVIPVWRSHAFPVRLRLPDEEGAPVEELSTAVGVALLATTPIPEIDWTLSDTKPTEPVNSTRMFGIATYFEQIARPIIDQGLYGELVSLMLQKEARDREWAMINASIGHALKEPFPHLQEVIEQGRQQLRASLTTTLEQLKRTFDELDSTLSPASGIASMSTFLMEAQKKGRTFSYGFQSVEEPSPNFLCLSADYLRRRLLAAMDYAQKINRSGFEKGICETLNKRGNSNLILWQASPTLQLRKLRTHSGIVNADDPAAGACNSVLTELLINAVRYNDSVSPGLLIIVAEEEDSLNFMVLNQLNASAPTYDGAQFENISRDQRAFVGLSLVKYCFQALKWRPELFYGPLDSKSQQFFRVLQWASLESERLKELSGIDLNTKFQAIGFNCPIVPAE